MDTEVTGLREISSRTMTRWFRTDLEYEYLEHRSWLEATKPTPRSGENNGGCWRPGGGKESRVFLVVDGTATLVVAPLSTTHI